MLHLVLRETQVWPILRLLILPETTTVRFLSLNFEFQVLHYLVHPSATKICSYDKENPNRNTAFRTKKVLNGLYNGRGKNSTCRAIAKGGKSGAFCFSPTGINTHPPWLYKADESLFLTAPVISRHPWESCSCISITVFYPPISILMIALLNGLPPLMSVYRR
jgi:hypothetical protein